MRFRERLKLDHPEMVDDVCDRGCVGCPENYGYEDTFDCFGISCEECWSREIPESEEHTGKRTETPACDLIDRQATIDAVIQKPARHNLKGSFYHESDIRDAIKSVPSAQPEQRWIPVTERLPKDMEFVLMTIRRLSREYNQTPFISVGYIGWNNTTWWCAHDGRCDLKNIEVVAWMSLPAPYQTERRTNGQG